METELHKKGFFMPIDIFLSYLLILGFMIVGTFESQLWFFFIVVFFHVFNLQVEAFTAQ